jgi:hypothetical protein
MKVNDIVISTQNCVMDIWEPNCYLKTYAEIEEDMEGYVERILNPDEILVNFHGVTVIVYTDEFACGEFILQRELTGLKLVVPEEKNNKLN